MRLKVTTRIIKIRIQLAKIIRWGIWTSSACDQQVLALAGHLSIHYNIHLLFLLLYSSCQYPPDPSNKQMSLCNCMRWDVAEKELKAYRCMKTGDKWWIFTNAAFVSYFHQCRPEVVHYPVSDWVQVRWIQQCSAAINLIIRPVCNYATNERYRALILSKTSVCFRMDLEEPDKLHFMHSMQHILFVLIRNKRIMGCLTKSVSTAFFSRSCSHKTQVVGNVLVFFIMCASVLIYVFLYFLFVNY